MSLAPARYQAFSAKAAIQLASPPTWSAAIMPVLVGGTAAFALSAMTAFSFDLRAGICWLLMLVCSLLMQSAVNSLNDYKDFLAGTDTKETILDETDASIVYNDINPRSALYFGIVLLALAAVCGVTVALLSQWYLIILGVIGAAVVVLYSFGPKPISYLPLGELMSGLMMGGIITVATYIALTQAFNPLILAVAVPTFLTIALIMLTNNICDIERDSEAGRHTLAVRLGRIKAMHLAGAMALAGLAVQALLSFVFWLAALLTTAIAALAGYHRLSRIMHGPYSLANRRVMMGNVSAWCALANLCWAFGLLLAGLTQMLA
jgi:1,4-dihydroxy-2-naphthoate octaprenyltransferase